MAKARKVGTIDLSKIIHLNPHLVIKTPVKQKKGKDTLQKTSSKRSKEKDCMNYILYFIAKKHNIELVCEHTFHPTRKWRFDWCLPSLKIAIEYNGIMSKKSRHTTVTGYSKDMDKINSAQKLGWKVLQYTPLNYKKISEDLEEIIKLKEV